MPYSQQEIFRVLREGIVRDAVDTAARQEALTKAVHGQAARAAEAPVNGLWDDDGQWQEFFTFGIVGFGDGGLA